MKINSLNEDYVNYSDAGIYRKLISLPEFLSAKRIFTYVSIKREPDTRKLINTCHDLNKEIFVPCDVQDGNMNFTKLDCRVSDLNLDKYGIPSPSSDGKIMLPKKGDIIIVPALCCSSDGQRLGHGGGYYDRYLENCDALTLCLCREKLLQKNLPYESHDVPVDVIITEENITRPRRAPR